MNVGTKKEVYAALEGEMRTSGGLFKSHLMKNKRGKIVSKARSLASQKNVGRLKKFQFKKKDCKVNAEPLVGPRKKSQTAQEKCRKEL